MISRREFVAITAGALALPSVAWAGEEFPSLLDHIILACSDLDAGIRFFEERTGVRAAIGGVHPNRGTMNALASLGDRHYLEIMAPDPNAKSIRPESVEQVETLKQLKAPRLLTWAAHPGDMDAFASKLRAAAIHFEGPTPGSRVRPDGRVLQWKTINLADSRDGLLPFFIEWSAASVHPSSDSPQGCRIERFTVADQNSAVLLQTFRSMGLEVRVEMGDRPQLHARIAGPKGTVELTS